MKGGQTQRDSKEKENIEDAQKVIGREPDTLSWGATQKGRQQVRRRGTHRSQEAEAVGTQMSPFSQ